MFWTSGGGSKRPKFLQTSHLNDAKGNLNIDFGLTSESISSQIYTCLVRLKDLVWFVRDVVRDVLLLALLVEDVVEIVVGVGLLRGS